MHPIDETFYKQTISDQISSLGLIEKAKNSMHTYFEAWEKESKETFHDFLGSDFKLYHLEQYAN